MLTSLALLSGLSLYPMPTDTDSSLFHYTNIEGYSEDLSIYHLVKDQQAQNGDSEFTFTLDETITGVQYGDWSLSTFFRYEWYLGYSADTMRLYQDSLSGSDMQSGKTYQVDIDVEHLRSQGLRLGWYKELDDNFAAHIAASLIDARKMMSGNMTGDAVKTSGGDYAGQLELDYTYSEDVLFDRSADRTEKAYGHSVDLGFDWQIKPELFLSFYARDLISNIYWDHMPTSVATANTATAYSTNEGYININPTISGVHSYHDYVQHIPTKYQAKLSYLNSATSAFSLSNLYLSEHLFTDIGWINQWDTINSELSYNLQTQAIGVKLSGKLGYIGLKMDKLDYQQASYLGLSWGFNIAL